MSKAIIVKHLGKAKYRVKLQVDTERLDALRDALQLRIDYADQRIAGELQTTVSLTLSELSMAPEAKQPEKRFVYESAVRALAYEKVRRQKAIDERARLAGQPSEIQRDIWCADYSTRLPVGTEVGVIDWLQVRGKKTTRHHVILPGYNFASECAYNVVRDGRTVPQLGLSTYTWWYNMMAAPCMERFDPHYRRAHITAIDVNGLADVMVEQSYTQVLGQSEAQPLSVQELVLHRVPVHYMCADAAVFQVGDWVVLEYPRKNLHADLVTAYEAQLDALERRKTQLDNDLLTASSLQKPDLLMSLAQVKIAIGKMTTRVEDERDKSALLAAYTRTRPTEITIIGFVENPRPCRGIAFQKYGDPDWWVVSPLGAERKLSTAPALVGPFNWGVKNTDGDYDCACVWTDTQVRHGGYTYTITGNGIEIQSAGVLRDIPGVDRFTIYTVEARLIVHPPDPQQPGTFAGLIFSIRKTVVSNGVIHSTSSVDITLGDFDTMIPMDRYVNSPEYYFFELYRFPINTMPPIRDVLSWPTYMFGRMNNAYMTNPPPAEMSTKVLISKDCKFIIIAQSMLSYFNYNSGLEQKTPYRGYLWTVDVSNKKTSLLSGGVAPDSYIDFQSKILPDLGVLYYNANGDIATVAFTKAMTSISPPGYAYEWSNVTFKNGSMQIGTAYYSNVYVDDSNTTYLGQGNQLLCPVASQSGDYVISVEARFVYMSSASTVYNGDRSARLMAANINQQLINTGDITPYVINIGLTKPNTSMTDYSAAQLDGWSAGCVRVKVPYVDPQWNFLKTQIVTEYGQDGGSALVPRWDDINEVYTGVPAPTSLRWYRAATLGGMFVEFRGDQCKIVRTPSFNYTIII